MARSKSHIRENHSWIKLLLTSGHALCDERLQVDIALSYGLTRWGWELALTQSNVSTNTPHIATVISVVWWKNIFKKKLPSVIVGGLVHNMHHECLCLVLYNNFVPHVAVKLEVLLRHGIAEYIWAKILWYMLDRAITVRVDFLLWIPTDIEVYRPYNNNTEPILKVL